MPARPAEEIIQELCRRAEGLTALARTTTPETPLKLLRAMEEFSTVFEELFKTPATDNLPTNTWISLEAHLQNLAQVLSKEGAATRESMQKLLKQIQARKSYRGQK